MSPTHQTIVLRLLVCVILSSLALSCKQYDYVSPLPGVLEVRLKVVNSRQDLIPFGSQNRFGLLLKELNGVQTGNIKQPIYADLNAIRRSPDGDPINALDTLARDSAIVLGQSYAPPVTFPGLDMRVEFDAIVLIIRGSIPFPNIIFVNPPAPPAPPVPTFFQIPASAPIQINEGRRTVVTVTFNLDSVLLRRSEFFEIYPSFYLSSVKNY